MIYNKTNNIDVQSTIQGKKIAMQIDDAARVHIMNLLTDLYSDPEAAIIREYGTNAYDSHIEAGNPAPIEITTPTTLSPVLRIRDYGIGLDYEGIENIYSKYGASTKRESNDFNGMLGLGCKSALTYTSQFTLIGIKDGLKTPVVIGREEDGTGSMTPLDATPTNERNGVEVVIPIKNIERITKKVHEFYRFWTPGTVLVDGKQPEAITGLKVTDDMIVVPTALEGQDYIVMGNVAYPCDLDIFKAYDRKVAIVAYVGIGEIAFTPSREAIYECPQTDATLAAVKQSYLDNISTAVEASIADAPDFIEAFRRAADWRKVLNRKVDVTYNNVEIPNELEAPQGQKFVITGSKLPQYGKKSDHSNERFVQSQHIANGLFVYDFHVQFSAAHKKKLIKYAEQNGVEVDYFILSPQKPDATWIPADRIVDYADIKAIKLEVTRTYSYTGGRLKGSYDTYTDGFSRSEVPADDLNVKGLCYLNTTEYGKDEGYNVAQALKQAGYKGTMVLLAQNRVDKFNRDFPKAKPVGKVLARTYNRMVKKISERDALVAAAKSNLSSSLSYLDADRINDPAVKDAINLLNENNSVAWDLVYSTFSSYNIRRMAGVERATRMDVEFNDPTDEYPLIDRYALRDEKGLEHTYTYINAVYAAKLISDMDVADELDAE